MSASTRITVFVIVFCPCSMVLQSSAAAGISRDDYTFIEDTAEGESDVNIVLNRPDTWAADGLVVILFGFEDNRNYRYLQIRKDGLELGYTDDGSRVRLAEKRLPPAPSNSGPYRMTIMRRNWQIRVLCDGKTALQAWHAIGSGKKVGYAGSGIDIQDLYVQPIGEMVFDDSFMRPPSEAGPWSVVIGDWQTALPRTRNRKAEAAKSANPFSYRARRSGSDEPAFTTGGYTFWDGYRLRAAVRLMEAGTAGIAGYVQGDKTYYLFTVRAAETEAERSKATARLIRVIDGNRRQLDEAPIAIEIDRWYELSLRIHSGDMRGLLDGREVCRATDDTLGHGKVGLYAEGCHEAFFDDVSLRRYRQYRESYSGADYKPVRALSGSWKQHAGRLCGIPDDSSRTAIALTGSRGWQNYRAELDVLPHTATGIGIYLGCRSPNDYYLFRWGPRHGLPHKNMQQLWRIEDGTGTIIDQRAAEFSGDRTYRVTVTADRNYIAVDVGDRRVVEGADISRPGNGRIGYYAEGGPQDAAAFDNLQVSFPGPPKRPVSITDQFAKEDTMANWARPMASWDSLGRRVYFYTLPVWGDFDIRCELGYFLKRKASIALRLASETEALDDSDNIITVKSNGENNPITCVLSDAREKGNVVESRPRGDTAMLRLQRRGSTIIARLDDRPIGWVEAADGLSAAAVGLKLGGAGISLNNIRLTSPNIVDTAFSDAPTEWKPQSGVWEISDRWNCSPDWSWFCGRQAETPLLWSKQTFSGDMVFEYWAGVMMNAQRGYKHPSDLNGIICGDGHNLCSGYAFVYAGDNNTCSKLIREGKTVAETSSAHFVDPSPRGDLNRFHRHWFHCRLERIDDELTFFMDGERILHYTDPDPLSGGNVGIWTHQHNGIMIARTRIAFQHGG